MDAPYFFLFGLTYSLTRFSHDISAAFSFVAHDQPIHSLNVLSSPEGPMVVSGSNDGTIKVFSAASVI